MLCGLGQCLGVKRACRAFTLPERLLLELLWLCRLVGHLPRCDGQLAVSATCGQSQGGDSRA